VALVGAGPGDPGLLTVRGLALIRAADVIVHDRLVDGRLLDEARPEALCISAGKRAGHHELPQSEINDLLVFHARRGCDVVRLKGGDPFVFGRGGEEAEALACADIPFEIVPGVSSALAAPAAAGIPVTHRRLASSFAVVTATESSNGHPVR
jgi:uroporphyrin-III C-methyltransferase